jgi:two-component system chemotaxis sensor kinase CheA
MLAGPHAEEAFFAACRQVEDQGPLYLIQVSLSPLCEMPLPRCMLVDRRLNELSAVLWAEPDHVVDWSVVPDMPMRFGWLVSGLAQPEEAQQALAGITDVENVQVNRVTADGGLVLSPLPGAGEQTSGETATRLDQPGERAKAQSIRVNVERLENLMNLVGELVIDQTRVQQVKTLFHRKFGADELVDQLGQLSDHLSRIIGELHEGVMKVRMLPIEQLFSRFPRMVRDLAVTVGKEIELEMDGKETELDRTLIEELGDPLIHILRNAVDHGIEPPSLRKQAGKREAGTIRLAASHEDNQVVIRIEDDGAGMDLERLKQTAIAKGLITEEEAGRLTEKEALALIFRPGFSTAAQVSEVSGRGVGMDIVRDSIERMNGTIDIDTTLGQGTRMRIALPLTLAIITGLKIAVDERIFLIPMNSVAEIIRLTPSDIRTIKGMPVTTVRERILPVLWLRDHFNYPRMTETGRHLPVVILEHGGRRLALVVDLLLGNQDIVLKSLGSLIGKSPSTSGATILGDGRVALILEVRELFKQVASHVGGVATGNGQEIEA